MRERTRRTQPSSLLPGHQSLCPALVDLRTHLEAHVLLPRVRDEEVEVGLPLGVRRLGPRQTLLHLVPDRDLHQRARLRHRLLRALQTHTQNLFSVKHCVSTHTRTHRTASDAASQESVAPPICAWDRERGLQTQMPRTERA